MTFASAVGVAADLAIARGLLARDYLELSVQDIRWAAMLSAPVNRGAECKQFFGNLLGKAGLIAASLTADSGWTRVAPT